MRQNGMLHNREANTVSEEKAEQRKAGGEWKPLASFLGTVALLATVLILSFVIVPSMLGLTRELREHERGLEKSREQYAADRERDSLREKRMEEVRKAVLRLQAETLLLQEKNLRRARELSELLEKTPEKKARD